MKNVVLLFIIGFIILASCDGRSSNNKSLSEKIDDTFNIEVYKPKGFVKRDTDTLLSNGFRVKITTTIDSSKKVTYTKKVNNVNQKTHYNNFKFQISVEKEGKLIYKDSFDKPKANTLFGFRNNFVEESPFYNFDKLSVLKAVEVDDEPSLKNEVLIDFIYAIPETNRYTEQTLFISKDGTINVVHTKVN